MGLLLLKVPQYEEEVQEPLEIGEGKEQKDDQGELQMKTVTRIVDEDQKEKALSIIQRDVPFLAEGGNYYAINEYAGKAIREDFLAYIKSLFPEFFEENNDYEEIREAMNKQAEEDQAEFIKANCTEYDFPCMEFY